MKIRLIAGNSYHSPWGQSAAKLCRNTLKVQRLSQRWEYTQVSGKALNPLMDYDIV
jgi:hypothetical protein